MKYLILFILFISCFDNKVELSKMPKGGDFNLPSTDGPYHLSKRGPVVLLSFGYTYCPDICPTTLATMGNVLSGLSKEELSQVESLFISVDPQRDTLERLKEYASFFHPKVFGATSSEEDVKKIADLYRVQYAKHFTKNQDPKGNEYNVDHSTQSFIVYKGRLEEVITYGTPAPQIILSVQRILKENK